MDMIEKGQSAPMGNYTPLLPMAEIHVIRAAAHAALLADLRPAQRWQFGVTDEDVAMVMYALEDGARLRRLPTGRWRGIRNGRLSDTVNEMIRTGLVRHLSRRTDDYLVPALVHLADPVTRPAGGVSMCRFTGEDMGPMRARLVDDLSLVDCLECEAAVSRGHARGL